MLSIQGDSCRPCIKSFSACGWIRNLKSSNAGAITVFVNIFVLEKIVVALTAVTNVLSIHKRHYNVSLSACQIIVGIKSCRAEIRSTTLR